MKDQKLKDNQIREFLTTLQSQTEVIVIVLMTLTVYIMTALVIGNNLLHQSYCKQRKRKRQNYENQRMIMTPNFT